MLNPLRKIFGSKNSRDLKTLRPYVERIAAFSGQMEKLDDGQLQGRTALFKERLAKGETLLELLPEAFAVIREASWRVLHMRHFDVQLMGGVVLFEGKIAEMKTGEGKTLTATLSMYLHALAGKGTHLVTVNDYLAKRDAEWMGELYQWMGLSIGYIVSDMDDKDRAQAYGCDITYGTNNEFAFDYLRDNMKFSLDDYVQRDHHYCIVDEVDSILIDEARTPLLISGPSKGDTKLYHVANRLIPKLAREKHFTVDLKSRTAIFTEEGIIQLQELLKIDNLYNVAHAELLHHINQALKAHHLFSHDVDYVVRNGKVIIVDEFTGRLKEGSRWSDGLHQSVEAKENVPIKSENQTLASITFQNYFRRYKHLAGMTGTADTEAEEFEKIYSLQVVVIPTNLPMIRIDNPDLIYKNKKAKLGAITNSIAELYEKGQPVLVGTISIESSEEVSRELKKRHIPHQVLNAKNHKGEASIISKAGEKKSVTIATNMAGRGTDIKLTEETKEVGGLYILGTERHESRRIDNQLRGRSGRQGDKGESRFYLSLEDDLMKRFGSGRIQGIMNTLGMEENEPIEHRMVSNAIAKAQKKVEGFNFDMRKHLLEYDDVMNEQRKVIYRLRREILGDQQNMELVEEMIDEVAERLVDSFRPEKKVPLESWSWSEIAKSFQSTFNTTDSTTDSTTDLIDLTTCQTKFDGELERYLATMAKEILRQRFLAYEEEQVTLALREILLSIFDQHWKDHLLAMDHLKEGINLRAYAQKDPLNEYKREAFTLFEQMKIEIKRSVVENIFNIRLYSKEEMEELKRQQQKRLQEQMQAHQKSRQAQAQSAGQAPRQGLRRQGNKISRNAPCPCGSGKKFKHCHGA